MGSSSGLCDWAGKYSGGIQPSRSTGCPVLCDQGHQGRLIKDVYFSSTNLLHEFQALSCMSTFHAYYRAGFDCPGVSSFNAGC